MTQNIGTLVISAIRPNDSEDDYPTFLSSELRGCLKQVNSYTDLSTISAQRRLPGMIVNVTNDPDNRINGSFKLENDLITWTYTIDNNEVITLNAGSLTSDKDLTVLLDTPHIYEVDRVYTKSISGTCTVEVNRFKSASLGFNIATSSSLQNVTSSSYNYIDKGNYISVKITNVVSVVGLLIQINLKRILPKVEQICNWLAGGTEQLLLSNNIQSPDLLYISDLVNSPQSPTAYISTLSINFQPAIFYVITP
jgi:hypothetical protein